VTNGSLERRVFPSAPYKKYLNRHNLPDRYIRVRNDHVLEWSEATCALAREGEVKTSTTIALALTVALSGSPAAHAQTEQPTLHHHTHRYAPHHPVHRHTVAHGPAMAPAGVVAAPQAAPFGLALPHIAPYPNNKGDEDGLSDDVDNCNKGCVGGAPD
jgi:hypothetical protein